MLVTVRDILSPFISLFVKQKSLSSSNRATLLFSCLLFYLLAVRSGPILTGGIESTELTGGSPSLSFLHSLVLNIKHFSRYPSLLSGSRRSMGSCCSKPVVEPRFPKEPVDTGVSPEVAQERHEETIEQQQEEEEKLPAHSLDPEGRVRGARKGSIDSSVDEIKRIKDTDRRDSTQSTPTDSLIVEQKIPLVKFRDIEESLATGDLALLYRHGEKQPNYGIFVNHGECDPYFPLLLIKGKTKPMPLSSFNPSQRDVRVITAVTRIFYGDYETVAVRRLKAGKKISCGEAMEAAIKVEDIPFTAQEMMFINEAATDTERSLYTCTFALSHVYKELGIMLANPIDIRPDTFEEALPLSSPICIKLPAYKPGPLIGGTPPLLSQLVDGIRHPPEFPVKTYGEIRDELQTGDIVLFSGATSSGALIKIFDGAVFSHVGLVLRPRYSSYVLVWESSTNKAGLVDVDSGSVRKGVELLPLRNKIFSGWYNRVAIRRLTGLTDEQRQKIYEKMLEVRKELQGRPYEKNHLELIMSGIDVDEGYLDFLRTDHEDLSSIFCSELIAHTYQELGLINKERLSNTYTPDDFASHRDMTLNYGSLKEEVYIDLKFDYDKDPYKQRSISAKEAKNK